MKANGRTKVLFRWWRGDVIAIFPEESGAELHYCVSYQHVGQHGDCEPHHIIRNSRPATTAEYWPLGRELGKIGYRLLVLKRGQWLQAREIRRAKLDAFDREMRIGKYAKEV